MSRAHSREGRLARGTWGAILGLVACTILAGCVRPPPSPPSPSAAGRTGALWPFASTAAWNVSIGHTAAYGSATAPATATFLDPEIGTAVNSDNWSAGIFLTKASDPLVNLTDVGVSPATTLRVHIPADAQVAGPGTDRTMIFIQPDGFTVWEAYKFSWADDDPSTHVTGSIARSTYVNTYDLRGDGLQAGSQASGIAALGGMLRTQEIAARSFPHAVKIGVPSAMLQSGPLWPARRQDAQQGANIYSGAFPLGTMFAIPASVNLSSIGLSPDGLALGQALQDFGGYCLVQSSTVALFAEPTADPVRVAALRIAWSHLRPLMRRVTNNHPGTLIQNTPVSIAGVAGGGTGADGLGDRRRPPAPPIA